MVTFNSKMKRISTRFFNVNKTKERLPSLILIALSMLKNQSLMRNQRPKLTPIHLWMSSQLLKKRMRPNLTLFWSLACSSRRYPLKKRKLNIIKSWRFLKASRKILGISRAFLSRLSTMIKIKVFRQQLSSLTLTTTMRIAVIKPLRNRLCRISKYRLWQEDPKLFTRLKRSARETSYVLALKMVSMRLYLQLGCWES